MNIEEHLRRRKSALKRWSNLDNDTGNGEDDTWKSIFSIVVSARKLEEVTRAKIFRTLYDSISIYSSQLKNELMLAAIRTDEGYQRIGIRKGLGHLNKGYPLLSEHLASLTEENRSKLFDQRFSLFSDLYNPANWISSEEFGKIVLEDNGLDRDHTIGWVNDFFETPKIVAPSTIITSKHSSIGSGCFLGFRFYKSLRECLQAEVAHAIGYEIDAHNNYDEEINYEIFDRVIFEALCILEIWKGKEISLECCTTILETLSSFEYLNFFGICTLGSYLKEACSIDGWSAPLDRLETMDFEFIFGIPLSGFDWNHIEQVEWLKENLKLSEHGI
jgi:hypothetical protein